MKGLGSGIWWIPLVFALLVAGVGSYAYRSLEGSTRNTLRSSLEAVLNADVSALHQWVEGQKNAARAVARDHELHEATKALLETFRAGGDVRAALLADPARARVSEILEPELEILGFQTFGLAAHDGTTLASSREDLIGQRVPTDSIQTDRLALGETIVSHPLRLPSPGATDEEGDDVVIFTLTPILDEDGRPDAMLALSSDARHGFTKVLQTARMGESGETYAFNAQGILLSGSRFEDELVRFGIVEKKGDAILSVSIRDPGGNRLEGFVPTLPVQARPLTRMAAAAISTGTGYDIDGYPDYRGVPVVGVWTWLPELALGVTTEINVEEAYAGLRTIRLSFAALAGLLVVAALGMLGYSLILRRVQGRYEEVRKMGRYEIEEKIGEGGMGTVYRARHALLRRPTAIKLLSPDKATPEAVARFEREVQAISGLSHPNTIAVFDYGRTPDNSFYYAMEYVQGITLARLIESDGAQPEARVEHILRQAAGSLGEAHDCGLIHRDFKPANIMLGARGGLLDFIKVLDFGLVRAEKEDVQLTSANALPGTPQYMAPEVLQAPETVDARSDVYQLGLVAYELLTGRPAFQGQTVVELMGQHLHANPVPPSEVIGSPIAPDLEELVLACLAKTPAARPAKGRAFLRALDACRIEGSWTQEDAYQWWEAWSQLHPLPPSHPAGSGSSLPSGWEIDLAGRSRRA